MTNTPDTYWDLFAGYTAFWLLIVFYLLRMMKEQGSLVRRLDALEQELKNPDKNAASPVSLVR